MRRVLTRVASRARITCCMTLLKSRPPNAITENGGEERKIVEKYNNKPRNMGHEKYEMVHSVTFVVAVALVTADQIFTVHKVTDFLYWLGGIGDEHGGRGSGWLLPHDLDLDKYRE